MKRVVGLLAASRTSTVATLEQAPFSSVCAPVTKASLLGAPGVTITDSSAGVRPVALAVTVTLPCP